MRGMTWRRSWIISGLQRKTMQRMMLRPDSPPCQATVQVEKKTAPKLELNTDNVHSIRLGIHNVHSIRLGIHNVHSIRLGIHNVHSIRLGIHNVHSIRLGIHNVHSIRLGIHNVHSIRLGIPRKQFFQKYAQIQFLQTLV